MNAVGYDLKFAAETIWKVALASLILGAGLPILYASGIRSLAWGTGGDAEVGQQRSNPFGKVLAGVIFFIVAYAIISGIIYIIATGKGANYDITFKNLYPEIQKKS
jgi:hypothetical protein